MVEALFASGIITRDARRDALELLYPAQNWGLWVSRLLLVLGVALVLSGIVYFFAFNWAKVPVAAKFGVVEAGLFGCLLATFLLDLRNFPGKLALLSASVLVGVFMAVFGQIYQTGADAYTLFMMWAIVILPWVLIAEFAPLWVVWLAVANLFITLYWDQVIETGHHMQMMQFVLLSLFYCVFLVMREFVVLAGAKWLDQKWTRFILIVPILGLIMVPTTSYIFDSGRTQVEGAGVVLSLVIHLTFFGVYRFKLPDMWALTATLISACIVVECVCLKWLGEGVGYSNGTPVFLLMGLVTLGIFSVAIIFLRAIAASMEARNA